jgi:hypothetical protein
MRSEARRLQLRALYADARAVWPVFLVHLGLVLATIAIAQDSLPNLSRSLRPETSGFLIAGLSHWDGTWFLLIAQSGYPAWRPESAAFFPLYPLTMAAVAHAASFLLHFQPSGAVGVRTYLAAGIAISNTCLYAAFVVLLRIGRLHGNTRSALRGLWLLGLFPSAFYLSAVYSESMFLLWSSLSLWCGYARRWWAAGAFTALALLTRNVGIFLVPALLWLLWMTYREGRQSGAKVLSGAVAVCLLPAASLGLFMLLLWRKFHQPLEFLWAESHHWHRHWAWPWTSLYLAYRHDPVGFLSGVLFLVLLAYAVGKLPVEQWLFSAGLVLVPLCSVAGNYPMSLVRLVLVAFPLFLLIGRRIRRTETFTTTVCCSAVVMAWLTSLFATAHWVA